MLQRFAPGCAAVKPCGSLGSGTTYERLRADAFEQRVRLDLEGARQPDDRGQPRVALAALEQRDLGPVHSGSRPEADLRHAEAVARRADVPTELLSRIHVDRTLETARQGAGKQRYRFR